MMEQKKNNQTGKMSRRTLLTSMGVAGAAVVAGGLGYTMNDNIAKSYAQIGELNMQLTDVAYVVKPEEGVTEYSTILNEAFQNYSSILIKNGHYPVDVTKILPLKSHTIISFEPNAWLKVLPNNRDKYALLDMTGINNVIILNPNLEGDKYEHTGTVGQWGHGINIVNSQNVKIYNPRANKFWGDGLYIRGVKNVDVYNGLFDDNRRQGISVIYGENIYIHRPVCSNTGGHPPGAGIDIEPNQTGEHLRNVIIYEPRLINNGIDMVHDYGMAIAMKQHYSTSIKSEVSVNIINPVFENCSLTIETRVGTVGEINVINPKIHTTMKNAIWLLNCDSDELHINVENPIITNPNRSGRAGVYSNGISFEEKIPMVTGFQGMKNITVTRPVISNTDNPCVGIIAVGTNSQGLKNCKVIEPQITGDFTAKFAAFYGGNITPVDASFVYELDRDEPPVTVSNGTRISNDLRQTNVAYAGNDANGGTIYVTDAVPVSGVELRFENQSPQSKPLKVSFGVNGAPSLKTVYPLSATPVNEITLPNRFSWVKLRKISATEFIIVASSGNIQ